MKFLRILFLALFSLSLLPTQVQSFFNPLDSLHNNNILWTGFDPLNGDIGNRENSSLEYPGGSRVQHILRGCHSIGLISPAGDTLVVSNKLC
ncbi:hypothetical protein JW890_09550 [candidate division WOR-3 bacterium]|nr:hypothetical protein [candidate division WOR-3 bacterium]